MLTSTRESVMLMAQRCVEIARKRGEAKKPRNRVYRMLSDQALYLEASAKLYANPGAMTSGVDSEDPVDGMSLRKIDRIIERLQQGNSTWKPVRRV